MFNLILRRLPTHGLSYHLMHETGLPQLAVSDDGIGVFLPGTPSEGRDQIYISVINPAGDLRALGAF
jgi:hypothetical protein